MLSEVTNFVRIVRYDYYIGNNNNIKIIITNYEFEFVHVAQYQLYK